LQYAVKIIIALSIFNRFLKELLTYYLKKPPYNWLKMKCRFETFTISINAVKITLLFKKKTRQTRSSMSCVCHLELHRCKVETRFPMNCLPFHDCLLLELSMNRFFISQLYVRLQNLCFVHIGVNCHMPSQDRTVIKQCCLEQNQQYFLA